MADKRDYYEVLGVNKKTISSWESGKTTPQIDKIEALCSLYGLTYEDIAWRR